MKEIIIFCQAPADIQYALTIYERNKKKTEITIFCINVKGIYNFIRSLKLDLKELVFIPYTNLSVSYKKPNEILKLKRRLNLLFKNNFKYRSNYEVFFFSHFFDYITFFFVKKLSKNNSVNFINHYDDAIKKNYYRPKKTISKLIYTKFIFKFITGISFDFYKFNSSVILEFPFEKYKIEEIRNNVLDMNVLKKYSYDVRSIDAKKILLLEGDYKIEHLFKDYEKDTKTLLQYLKNLNYKIYLKPHPRIGYSKFLDDYIDSIVNADVPAEFIDETKFKVIIGISSLALAYFANRNNVNVISLINIYQYKDDKTKKRAFEYLNDISSNINFIKNLESFKKEITLI